jgi:hypothetical protein
LDRGAFRATIDRMPKTSAFPGRPDLAAATEVAFIDVPTMRIVRVDGAGDPNTAGGAFQEAMAALFPLVYTLRFALKRGRGIDTRVGPPEGLWWDAADGPAPGSLADQPWSLFVALPDEATEDDIAAAFAAVRAKQAPVALDRVRCEPFAEGRAAQVLHVGPYAAETPTIARLHAAIEAAGLTARGRHHEIYVGDPRRSAPERLRTILRQPVG